MVSSIKILGFPKEYLNEERKKYIENRLRTLFRVFFVQVKSDSSIKGKEEEREIKVVDSFPVYFLTDESTESFIIVEAHIASCILTRSVYWAEKLTRTLRKFFAPIISACDCSHLNLEIRFEIMEVKFVDNGTRVDN